jgi:fluoroquinolone transport system permease protein
MNALSVLRRLGPVDWRNVRRDPMLVWIPLLPLVFAAAVRFGVPPLGAWLMAEHGFDLAPYFPLVMSLFLLLVPNVAGMMAGFLLLDERDERTLEALRVTPLPLRSYMLYRLATPMALGMVLTVAIYPAAGLVPLPAGDLIAIGALAAVSAPLVMLFLAAFAENKVAGFAMVKLLNGVLMIPVAAFFIPGAWQYAAGTVPSFWALKGFWLAAEGVSYWPVLVAGVVANGVVGWLLLRRFERRLDSG